jgi:transcriptional regulator with XRE-family HTH domain
MTPQWTRGERLRKARTTAGITVEVMARHLGCTERTIRNYELGSTRPNKPTMTVWATLTDVPLWWLDDLERSELLVIDDKPSSATVPRGYPPLRHPIAA